MLMKDLKGQKLISSRLYNYLRFAFRHTSNNLKEYYAILAGYIWNCTYVGDVCVSREYLEHYHETLSFDKMDEVREKYFDKMDEKFADSSLEEVLKELNVQEPEDIMQFRALGKKSVAELRNLIEGSKDEQKAI